MKSIKNLHGYPNSLSVIADDILEFHAARILLLLGICGDKGQIKGLTKMAKLDFFVRYPLFFIKVANILGESVETAVVDVESKMVRYHYGPWDQRYYHVLAYLESKGLIQVVKSNASINLSLSALGKATCDRLEKNISFSPMISQMQQVKNVLGNKKGNELKNLIYQVFDTEIKKLSMGEVINQ